MHRSSTIRLFGTALLIGLLAACAPTGARLPAEAPAAPSDRTGQKIQELESRVQRLQDSMVMLEARLLDQQQALESLRARPAAPVESGTPDAGEAVGGAPRQTPTEIYLAAFGDYAAGQYQKSITGFSRFLQYFPANDYAGNARYWLAECYLALGHYEQAAAEFDRVAIDYPRSPKAPDALLKKAAALYQMGQEERALESIQLLKERYPKSSAAQKAAESFN